MDEKTKLVVEKLLDLHMELLNLLEEVADDTSLVQGRTIDRIRSHKDKVGMIKQIISGRKMRDLNHRCTDVNCNHENHR